MKENSNQMTDRLFSHIEIGIHKYCNSKCPFCPHGQEESAAMPKGTMPEDLYRKVLNDLREMRFSGRISFHLMNEPLLCKNLQWFVKLAREYCAQAVILIITNGSVLTSRSLQELFKNGADRVAINHYSKAKSRRVFSFLNILLAIVKMNRRKGMIYRLSYLAYLAAYYLLTLDDSTRKYFRIFLDLEQKHISKISLSITSFFTNYSNRAGNLKSKVLSEPLREFCLYPFVQMYIAYDGKALICSADYFHQEVVGDVRTTSLLEIWNSQYYRVIRSKLFNGDRRGLLCERCDTFFLYEPDLYYPVPGEW